MFTRKASASVVAVLAALCAPGQDVAAFGRPGAVAPRLRGARGAPSPIGACRAGSQRPTMDQHVEVGARQGCRLGPVHGGVAQRHQQHGGQLFGAGAGQGREPEGGGDLRFPAHLLQRDGWPGPGNDDSWKSLERVFVILFGIPGGGEGIYSLQTSSVSAVLIFQDEDDATRYGDMLEAEGSNTAPRVEACDPLELELFLLEKDNFDFTFIPAGTTLMPPRENDLQ